MSFAWILSRRRISFSLAIAALLLTFSPFASFVSAQSTGNGSVRGTVRDTQGAVLPGVAITVSSPDVAGKYAAITDANGRYRVLDLPPASYAVAAQLDGFETLKQEPVVVRAGVNVGLDMMLTVGNMTETVVVNGDAPMLETRSAVTAVNISGAMQRSLPLSRRNVWYDFLRLTPGTVNERSSGASAFEMFYVNGAEFTSHVIQLDGVDIAPGAQSSNLYTFMSSEVLQDVQVKTAGVDAASPLGAGAVINMVSRSGTDVWHGNGALTYQAKRWNGNNNPAGTTSAFSNVQPDVTMGGPAISHRAWVFGSYRFTDIHQDLSRTAAQLATLRALAPGYDPLDRETSGFQTYVKGTIQLSEAHRFAVFDQYGTNAIDSLNALDTTRSLRSTYGGNTISAILDSNLGHGLTSRFSASYNTVSNPTKLSITNSPAYVVTAGVLPSSGVLTGTGTIAQLGNSNLPVEQDAPGRKLTFAGDVTWLRNWVGAHEVQAGFYVQPQRLYKFTVHYANNGFAVENDVLLDPADPSKGYRPYARVVYDPFTFVLTDVNTSDYAGYIQDTWKLSRATISAGVRIDKIKGFDRVFDTTTKDMLAVGPRLGLNISPSANGRHALRASFGIVHDAVSNNIASAGSVTPTITTTYDVNLDGTFDTTLVTPGTSAINRSRIVDLDHYNPAYVRELSLGYTTQWPHRWTTDVSYVNRQFRDRIANVAINSQYQGQQFTGYADPTTNEIYQVVSNRWNWPVYNALTVQGSREGSVLRVIASYTRQFRHLAGTWQPNDPASFIQPGAFPNDRGIGGLTSATQNSLSGTDMINAPQWRDNVATAGLSGHAPWGALWAISYSFQSGPYSGPVVTRIAAPDPQFGPTSLTINGRLVQNPLATQIRFANATRGDGQFTLDGMHIVNMRLGRRFLFRGLAFDGAVDVLNLLNGDGMYDFLSGANQTYSTNYRQGTNLQTPRAVQLTIRLGF